MLVILVAGIALCTWKWNTWFSNPPEAAYQTPQNPDRIVLTMGEDASTTRRISWRCDTLPANGYVELLKKNSTETQRIDATSDMISSRSGKSLYYNVEIQNLVPGGEYNYRVVNGNQPSPWYHFSIPAENDSLSFIYIGDVQDKIDGTTGEFFSTVYQQYPHADFWAFAGDLIERPTDAYWTHWYQTMDSIATNKPLVVATGNHEYLKGLVKTLDPRWTSTFSFPENGPEDFRGRSYYLNFKNLCFIVMDTDGIQGPGSLYQHYVWLKEVLEHSTQQWKILMMHHPVHSVRSGRDNYFVRYTFQNMLEQYGVDLVLQGHDHGYSRITTKNEEQQKISPVYIVSSSSPKNYSVGFNPIHDRLGSNLMLYQHILIKGDSLQYKSYTADHQIYDDLTIVNHGNSTQVIDHAENLPESLDVPPGYLNSSKFDLPAYQEKVKERKEHRKKLYEQDK